MRRTRSITFLSRAACFKSKSACKRIQNSGVLPKSLAIFKHMTADIGLRPARISWTICRDTPSAFAAAVTDNPTSGSAPNSTSPADTSPSAGAR